MATFRSRLIAVSLGLALTAIAAAEQPEAARQANAPLISVARRTTEVFASNKYGVFRANLESRQWGQLKLPAGMPLGGRFAKSPTESTILLYVASNRSGGSGGEEQYGVYASRDSGESWNLQSERVDYGPVLLLPNESLFAITNPLGNYGDGPNHILQSKDMGKTWQDITGKRFGWIHGVFPDPDHPNQVCLNVFNNIRGIILQADDNRYDGKANHEWIWNSERSRTTDFFNRHYSRRPNLSATLNNYFQYDFGDREAIPSLDLSTDEPRITVAKGMAVEVPITIRFYEDAAARRWRLEQRPARDPRGLEPTPTALIDSPSSWGLWGIRVEFQGQRTAKSAKVTDDINRAKDREAVRQRILGDTTWNVIPVTTTRPYRRKVDLSQLHDFTAPGTYKVQLTYDNHSLADRNKGHWVGSFSSPVFEVVVGNSK